jgi:hypothetical protein
MYVEVIKTVDAPLDELWKLLGDFANEGAATGLVETTGEGFGLGATCTSNVEGRSIRELCVNYDPEKFIVGYTVQTEENTTVYDYIGTARLYYVSLNQTRIHWFSHWRWRELPGNEMTAEDYEKHMKKTYLTVIDNMERQAQANMSSPR